jgi:hypothetical protein
MSQTAHRMHTLLLPLAAAAALAVLAPCPSLAAPTPTPAVQPATAPPASTRPGYVAETSCQEGNETANGGVWLSEGWNSFPVTYGHLGTCNEPGGAMTLRDEGTHDTEPESGPSYIYEAPVGSLIAGGTAKLTMTSPGGRAVFSAVQQKTGEEILSSCNEACTGVHSATVTIPDTEWWLLWARAVCEPPNGQSKCSASGVNAELSISTATILLHNQATPEATGLTGSLTETPVSGTANVAFDAHDKNGPGVYRVLATIEGEEVFSTTPNTEYGTCVAHGTYDGALNFRDSQPCPQETPVRIEIPTTSFSDGPHLVEVAIEDAAGNKSVVLDKTIQFQNHAATITPTAPSGTPSLPAPARGPANGSPASDVATIAAHWQGTKAAMTLKSPYGHPRAIEGRLTNPAGTPIVGALIEASQRPSSLGAPASAIPSTRTASDGSFTVRVPASDPSTTLELAYRSHIGDPQPAATSNLTLQVPASLHLTVTVVPSSRPLTRAVASVGQTILLHGTLAGPIPRTGKQVIFEARPRGSRSWTEFHNQTVTSRGQYSVSHRFALPGPQRYQFRVVCEKEPSFAFLRGASNVVEVRER